MELMKIPVIVNGLKKDASYLNQVLLKPLANVIRIHRGIHRGMRRMAAMERLLRVACLIVIVVKILI